MFRVVLLALLAAGSYGSHDEHMNLVAQDDTTDELCSPTDAETKEKPGCLADGSCCALSVGRVSKLLSGLDNCDTCCSGGGTITSPRKCPRTSRKCKQSPKVAPIPGESAVGAPAKCNSLPYTAAMCPSGALADNQGQIDCTLDQCVIGGEDDLRCCKDDGRWTDDKPSDNYCPFNFNDLVDTNEMSMSEQAEILERNNIPWQEIVDAMTKDKPKLEEPEVLVLLGGNAAGKTTALASLGGTSAFVNAGLNEVLEQLPDYKNAVQANPTYKRAALDCYPLAMLVLEQLYAKVQTEKLSVIIEFTGRSWKNKAVPLLHGRGVQGVSAVGGSFKHSKIGPSMHDKKKSSFFTQGNGYTTFRTVFIDSPYQNAVQNAYASAAKSGRFVPPEVVKTSYIGLRVAFEEAKQMATQADQMVVNIQVTHCVNAFESLSLSSSLSCCDVHTAVNAAPETAQDECSDSEWRNSEPSER